MRNGQCCQASRATRFPSNGWQERTERRSRVAAKRGNNGYATVDEQRTDFDAAFVDLGQLRAGGLATGRYFVSSGEGVRKMLSRTYIGGRLCSWRRE